MRRLLLASSLLGSVWALDDLSGAIPGFWERVFGSDGFMPHGHCYLWQTDLIWLHVISDGVIAFSYMTIPVTLGYFVRRRRDLPFIPVFWAFAVFIVSCGLTHVLEIWTLWTPAYWLSGWVKAVTAVASLSTAFILAGFVPRALALPSPAQLRAALAEVKRVEDRLRAATEGMVEAFFILEPVRNEEGAIVDFRFAEANPAALSLFKKTRLEVVGARFRDLPSSSSTDFARLVQVVKTRTRTDDEVHVQGAGQDAPRWIQRQTVPLADGVAVTSRDITERKTAELNRVRLASIVESTTDAIIGQSPNGTIESWNAGAERLYGYCAAEVIGRSVSLVVPAERVDEVRKIFAMIEDGQRVEVLDTIRIRKDGQRREVSLSVSPIRDDGGELVGISTIARDISQQKKSERLAHADLLLREVHHRVKNNLQMISSLLKLHADQMTDPVARAAFADSQDRVRSIALLHERLHQSKSPGDVDIGEYATSLVPILLRASSRHTVDVTIEANGLALSVDRAVPFGLILNELVSNAVKHAFATGQAAQPAIAILFEIVGEELVLTVRDNGRGFPSGFEVARSTGLGMHIVKTLTRQLCGSLSLTSPSGAECRLRFPLKTEGDS